LQERSRDLNPPDFSLVQGGPLYQIFRRTHLSGKALELLYRRILVISAICWLPLLILSLLEGNALAGNLKVPFLHDIEAHARFLVALPALMFAEVTVHRRLSPMVGYFVSRRIVTEKDYPAYDKAVASGLRIRNSPIVELVLLIVVFSFGIFVWQQGHLGIGAATWFRQPDTLGLHLTLAGSWYAYVSTPIFQFILLRWVMRIVIWLRLLLQISKLDLKLTASHPDRAGGIGFLGKGTYAFSPMLFAMGTLLSGMIATRVLYEGRALMSFQTEAIGLVVGLVLFVLAPLVIFMPLMERTQRLGVAEFGLLAQRYTQGFEKKWMRSETEESELLGSADIQSLADLSNSFSVVDEMNLLPFTVVDAIRLAVATAAPLVPLALTIFSVEELLGRLVKILL